MSKEGKFLAYCIEKYKFAKKLTGKQVAELFSNYDVWNYLYSCYEALHTTCICQSKNEPLLNLKLSHSEVLLS